MGKKDDYPEDLATWTQLNITLKDADEEKCLKLMELEKSGQNRALFIRRIYSRYNRMRAARERQLISANINTTLQPLNLGPAKAKNEVVPNVTKKAKTPKPPKSTKTCNDRL
jgi:hypothetical protein